MQAQQNLFETPKIQQFRDSGLTTLNRIRNQIENLTRNSRYIKIPLNDIQDCSGHLIFDYKKKKWHIEFKQGENGYKFEVE